MRIAWVTPYSFIDVDLPIIAELQNKVEIYWQIIVGKKSQDIIQYVNSQLQPTDNIKYEYVECHTRVYDLRTLAFYCQVLKRAKAFSPDIYYTSLSTAPFGPIVYKIYWPINRTIFACHNVSTPKGANREYYARLYTHLNLCTFKNIHVFSESQRDVLLDKYQGKNVLLAPLAIKDYGLPSVPIKKFDENKVVFLFFGIISSYKRLDLLIKAAQNIYERGYKNIKVKIAGRCKDWTNYQALIKYPEIFEKRIERIPNAEVANLFAESDYFVMPYQDIAQSGALTVAFRYNLPIILSNLSQFKQYGIDGKTCVYFESESVKDLEEKMIFVIEGGKKMYDELCMGLSEFVEQRFSIHSIVNEYFLYFKQLINSDR